MARNGIGTYVLPAGQPVVSNSTISSAVFNTLTADLANALTTSIASDGQTPMSANLPMAGNKLTGLSAGSLPGDSVRYEQLPSSTNILPVSSGGTGAGTSGAALIALGAQPAGSYPPRATRIDVASASTLDLTTNAPDTDDIRLTGTAAITLVNLAVGRVVRVVASGASSFANNASIVTQKGATLQLAAGDTLLLRAIAANVVEVLNYAKAADYVIPDGSITPAKLSQPFTLKTAIDPIGGAAIDFTGIPSWVKRITVMLFGLSTNGTSIPLLRIGTSGGIETSGYYGSGIQLADASSVNGAVESSGFQIRSALAANNINGSIVLTLMNGSNWVVQGATSSSAAAYAQVISGGKTTAGTLDRLRITTVNGTDAFDAGLINISYE